MAKIGLILTILLTMIMSPVLGQKRIVEKGIVYELCVWKKDGLQATVIGVLLYLFPKALLKLGLGR